MHGSVTTRTLTPGGDLLTLSTVAASPAITWARLEEGLRPARSLRYEVGVDRALGSARIGGPGVRRDDPRPAAHDLRRQHAERAQRRERRGPRVRRESRPPVRRRRERLGDLHLRPRPPLRDVTGLRGRGGHLARRGGVPRSRGAPGDGHRLVRHEGGGALPAELAHRRPGREPGGNGAASTATRFDVQLTQGLPFLQPLTRADWELLVAVRNMFYEASQGGFLDELAVQDPPTRVVGGISVRF